MIKLCSVGVLSNANAHQKLFISIDEFEVSKNIYSIYQKIKNVYGFNVLMDVHTKTKITILSAHIRLYNHK